MCCVDSPAASGLSSSPCQPISCSGRDVDAGGACAAEMRVCWETYTRVSINYRTIIGNICGADNLRGDRSDKR